MVRFLERRLSAVHHTSGSPLGFAAYSGLTGVKGRGVSLSLARTTRSARGGCS